MKKEDWGFDTRDMDTKVRPQDDFYRYANGNWLKRNPVPLHESRWGSFMILRDTTDKQLRQLLKKVSGNKRATVGSAEQL
ncbi:MAG: M13 family peptidase, partial [bacterium]|nr:M13 family peptidase [bacterium]